MRKLTLDMDALQVQSFATDEFGPLPYGTVHGHKATGGPETVCTLVEACRDSRACSDVDACPSQRGCSDLIECKPSQNPQGCQSHVEQCVTHQPDCRTAQCPSADDACPSARGCTEIGC
jgi:hypothetical protein